MRVQKAHRETKTAALLSLSPNVRTVSHQVDLRGQVPLTRHFYSFDIPVPVSTEANLRNPNKGQLRADIFALLEQGMSYRQIGEALGIHWTRVGQIIADKK